MATRSSRIRWYVYFVLVVYGVSIVRRGFSAKDERSALETLVARTARNLSLSASTRNVRNPLLATPENVHEGLEHFATPLTNRCPGCCSTYPPRFELVALERDFVTSSI